MLAPRFTPALFAVLLPLVAFGQKGADEPLPNFDARETVATPKTSAARPAALAKSIPTLHTELSRFGRTPEIVGVEDARQFLTAASSAPHESIVRDFLATQYSVYGLSPAEMAAG